MWETFEFNLNDNEDNIRRYGHHLWLVKFIHDPDDYYEGYEIGTFNFYINDDGKYCGYFSLNKRDSNIIPLSSILEVFKVKSL